MGQNSHIPHEVFIVARLSTPVNVDRSTSIAAPETLALDRALERKPTLIVQDDPETKTKENSARLVLAA
tara:strand:+ start:244 stop:450 length:207 start_codon:yes stop_codon:yes gene_type:complete